MNNISSCIENTAPIAIDNNRYSNFIGVGIGDFSYPELSRRIDEWLKDKRSRSHHIACLNAYCLALALKDKRLQSIYAKTDMPGPDGMPFVYWIRKIRGGHCDRFAAPDIALYLASQSKTTGHTFYLYGGAPDVLENMQLYLKKKFPHIKIVGAYSPPFRELSEEEDKAICDEINALQPDILLVGLGTPKQDYWIDDHLEKIRGSIFVASGATFDFFGGRIKMAPEWIRLSGFEWVYRLFSKDFSRLAKRYTYYHSVFIWNFGLQQLRIKNYTLKRETR